MSDSGHSNMSQGKGLPPFNHNNHQMELQNYPRRSKPSLSPTLAELLKRVDDAQSDTSNYSTPVHQHQVLELGYACSSMPPLTPFVLSFNNLTYSVKVNQKLSFPFCGKDSSLGSSDTSSMKVLLNDISGEAREGEIMAVLGASGSGKSTLIDALADRISKESLKGSVTLNGEVLESRLLKMISAYVMQDDLLFPMLTVEETLMFSADFRLPRSLSKSKKKARVQALIDQLGLRNAANTVIGDEGHRGVSGGERRRVSIGIDIVHDPILLFLDEPTSGLDSTSAFMVVKVLQRIAQRGSIVIIGAQERLGFFAFAMSTTYYTCAESIPAFLQERYIFMRETAYNAYRRSSYVLAHSLISIPSLVVLSIAFAATTFWAVRLDGGFSGFCFFFFTILSAFWAGSSFVTFLSGVVSHVMLGFTIVVAILAYFLLFSGFFISRDRIPSFWLWFHYISLVKYPYEAALQNEFHDPAKCFVRGVQMFDTTPLAAVPLSLKLNMLKSISNTLGMNITRFAKALATVKCTMPAGNLCSLTLLLRIVPVTHWYTLTRPPPSSESNLLANDNQDPLLSARNSTTAVLNSSLHPLCWKFSHSSPEFQPPCFCKSTSKSEAAREEHPPPEFNQSVRTLQAPLLPLSVPPNSSGFRSSSSSSQEVNFNPM
ncbi:hypothetical protein D5086_004944 [Populus alba]|uniref:Uncharacterized protein n=1 Tax=Populus alba TaxID=43335 RepID=A0ACC4CT10_POPAL